MISGDGDIHIVAWMVGDQDPTKSATTRKDGVATVAEEIVKDYRLIPHLGPHDNICPACAAAMAELRAKNGLQYDLRYAQATKVIAPPSLAPSFSPQYD